MIAKYTKHLFCEYFQRNMYSLVFLFFLFIFPMEVFGATGYFKIRSIQTTPDLTNIAVASFFYLNEDSKPNTDNLKSAAVEWDLSQNPAQEHWTRYVYSLNSSWNPPGSPTIIDEDPGCDPLICQLEPIFAANVEKKFTVQIPIPQFPYNLEPGVPHSITLHAIDVAGAKCGDNVNYPEYCPYYTDGTTPFASAPMNFILCNDGTVCCEDKDGDSFYASSTSCLTAYPDCDDNDPTVYPSGGTGSPAAPEVCDGKDNNCDGQIDEAPLPGGPSICDIELVPLPCEGEKK